MENKSAKVGLVGSGASTIYLLSGMLKDIDEKGVVEGLEVNIFEKNAELGMSMPYDPKMVDKVHVVNILPEETPELLKSFEDWLKARSDEELLEFGIKDRETINDKAIYRRVAMGKYLKTQYDEMVSELRSRGVTVNEHAKSLVVDAIDNPENDSVTIQTEDGNKIEVDRMVISTGHVWPDKDMLEHNYYGTPWPIDRILPQDGERLNHTVGLLGASLSGFDVLASLAERHGRFERDTSGKLNYIPETGTEDFNLVLHSSRGILPHIRCEFQWPHVTQYRFFSKNDVEIFMKKNGGKLRIEPFYQEFLKPLLLTDLRKNGMDDIADQLEPESAGFATFIDTMAAQRRYEDPFEGMKKELAEAQQSIETEKPIYWKETLDDLMYTLNLHTQDMPGEDLRFFQKKVIPFLINVTAFLPPESAEKLLALREAGKVSLQAGYVTVDEEQKKDGMTTVTIRDPEQGDINVEYPMFVDCTGQRTVNIDAFPFQTLVQQGTVREASSRFDSNEAAQRYKTRHPQQVRATGDGGYEYLPGGIEIDTKFHVMRKDGTANPRIYDTAYAHLKGQRPFFPGLQQCHDSGKIIAADILDGLRQKQMGAGQPENGITDAAVILDPEINLQKQK